MSESEVRVSGDLAPRSSITKSSKRRITRVPLVVRFRAAAEGRTPDECWPWPGPLDEQGYPSGGKRSPYRVSWEMINGPIPDQSLQMDHRCHSESTTCAGGTTCPHRSCVNPAHLRLVSASENQRLRADRRDGTCVRGHPMTAEFGRRQSDGRWKCRPCHNLRRRENRARVTRTSCCGSTSRTRRAAAPSASP
jgi:hypothetical protein